MHGPKLFHSEVAFVNLIFQQFSLSAVTCESLMIMTELVNGSYDPTLQVMSKSYMSQPAISGDSITFECSSGLVLNGSSSSMCTDDGQWLPNPQTLKCVNRTSINGN